MSLQIRFINDTFQSPFANMAIDEAIMRFQKELGKPTLRFYAWKPPAISIGYFQSLEEEVDLQKCREKGVEVIRRITGGGAVLHEEELTYSFVCPVDFDYVPKKIIDSYRKICQGIIEGFKGIDIEAQFVPLNDIVVSGKKISGNAQTRRANTILQHGTVLNKVDVDKMFSLLKVPNEKMKGKLISDIKQRVTSIEQELGSAMTFQDLKYIFRKGFENALGAEIIEDVLTKEEREITLQEIEKFKSMEWNFKK